jgi:hypothetical protein
MSALDRRRRLAVGSGVRSNVALGGGATAVVAVACSQYEGRLEQLARRIVFGAPTPAEVQAGLFHPYPWRLSGLPQRSAGPAHRLAVEEGARRW